MASAIKTTVGRKTVKTSATNLDLTANTQDEFNNLIEGYRNGYNQTGTSLKKEFSDLGKKKRDSLWRDLGAALSVIEIMSLPANAEWLDAVVEETGVPVVGDDETQNVYVMYLRILMGFYPDRPKDFKVGDPEPVFTWNNNVWLYASVLRGAVKRSIKGFRLYDQLVADKGLNKCKQADRTRLASDQEEVEKKARYSAVTADNQIKARLETTDFGGKKPSGLVALYGNVSADGLTIEVLGLLDDSPKSIEARIQKVADVIGYKVMAETSDRKAEQAEERADKLQARLDAELQSARVTVLMTEAETLSQATA
jgi:hypothetical protein